MPPAATQQKPSSVHAFLRRIAIAQYLFAWILLLAHGIAAEMALPALGLIPLTFSALLSGLLLHRDALSAAGSPIQTLSAQNVMFCDLAIAGLQLLVLVFSWIDLSNEWRHSMSQTILGTYGTVFLMLDCGIHFYFALTEIFHILTSPRCECPHCRSIHSRGRGGISLPTDENDEYTPLQSDVDEQAAPNDASDQV
ncbi:hypothetical protein PG996_013979 [Apiospora saccharicola]|uniref:MARVEL domain-containing protein n=1 Tax=Apiospora saccharicola TaxID=335842 RepID=A0ABR1TH02_9PEZI